MGTEEKSGELVAPAEVKPKKESWDPARGQIRVLPEVRRGKGGKFQTRPVSPLQGFGRKTRMARLVDFLEGCALLGGDVSAAKEALRIHQWQHEQEHGKPAPQKRDEGEREAPLRLIDDLGALPPGSKVRFAGEVTTPESGGEVEEEKEGEEDRAMLPEPEGLQ